MASTPSPSLCSHCSKVNLNPDHLLSCAHLGLISWSLGSLGRVKRNTCPLCKIVLLSLQRHHQAAQNSNSKPPNDLAISDADEVKLNWFAQEGPSRFGAFSVAESQYSWAPNFICFTADSQRPRSEHALIRNDWARIAYLHGETQPEFDIGRLRNWIECCDRFHCAGEDWSCSSTRQVLDLGLSTLKTLRLIDVRRNCITEFGGDGQDTTVPRYVALSYIWGGVPTVRLTSSNKPTLLGDGSLQTIWDSLPRTIRDAVVLLQQLGAEYQYLWVDSLCLVQDDSEDLEQGVKSMDTIYAKAWLTIVAAHGHNANAGLPGICWTTRVLDTYIVKVTEDASVGLYETLDVALDRTVYSTRAWTYQEQLLSNRAVHFLSNQVFFRCNGYAVDALSERMADPDSIDRLLAESLRMESWTAPMAAKFRSVGISGYSPDNPNPMADRDASVFCELIQTYSTKCLTYPDDVLRAMAGLMRFYEQRASYTFLEGMPTELFDAMVLFRSNGCALRRRWGYPSYSWAGWTGRVRFYGPVTESDVDANRWLNNNCPISWHVIEDKEYHWKAPRTPIWKPDLWEKIRGRRQALLLKWAERLCNHIGAGSSLTADETISKDPGLDLDNLPPAETAGMDMPDTSDLSFPELIAVSQVRHKLLQFWAISTYFRIEPRNIITGTVWIVDQEGEKVGMAWVDGIEDTSLLSSLEPVQFMLLSAASQSSRGDVVDQEARVLGVMAYDVLLLEPSGRVPTISERRGVGLLTQSGVTKSAPPGPRLSEIILG